MPFYEVFSMGGSSRGVYEYPDEISLRKFMRLLPNVENLLYHEVNETEALEIKTQIKEKIQKRTMRIMFDIWGQFVE